MQEWMEFMKEVNEWMKWRHAITSNDIKEWMNETNEWMTELMNWMNEWNEMKWNEINEIMNEWVNEWM